MLMHNNCSTGGMTVDWKTDTLYWSTLDDKQVATYNIVTSKVSSSSVRRKKMLQQAAVNSLKNQDGTIIHAIIVDPNRQGLPQGTLS